MNAAIDEAADVLRTGGVVAFPTETVYGLGADALNESAVKKVFQAKGRPADNPVIVHVAEMDQFTAIGRDIPSIAAKLAESFWPGPLTFVVKHRRDLPAVVTAGLETVAVRMPDHPVALALIRRLSRGIVGPSANLSGRPSPTTAQHVLNDLAGKIDVILDGGATRIGVESTVVDVTTSPPTILRLGGLPRESIERLIGPVSSVSNAEALKRSPGTRYRHYAPNAKVILVDPGDKKLILELLATYRAKRVACILHSIELPTSHDGPRIIVTSQDDYARMLFDSMRTLDEFDVEVIIVEGVPEIGMGEAVMDRLRRAAEG